MRNILRITAAACLMSAGSGAWAQSLEDTLEMAYETSPVLAAERTRFRQQSEGLVQARAGLLPTITAGASSSETNTWGNTGFFGGDSDSGSYSLSAQQTLFSGGRLIAGISQAEAQLEARRMALYGTEQDVLVSAVGTHMDVIRDQEIVSIRRNNVDVLSQQLQAARDRFEVGEITRTDVAQAEARLSGAQAQLSAAQASLAGSRAAYERVIGSAPVDLIGPDGLPSLPSELASAIETAINNNPLLLQSQYNEAAAEQSVKIARGARLPEISLSATTGESMRANFTGNEQGSTTIQGQVRIPIFTGGLNNSRVRSSLAARNEQRLNSVLARRQVVEQVTNAWNNYLAAQAVIESSQEAVRANEIAYDGVEQEAFVGLRTTLDVLNAEQELLNSRLNLVSAERDLYVASYILLQSMGFLTASSLELDVDLVDEDEYARQGRFGEIDLIPWN